jgi:hypothetical protein
MPLTFLLETKNLLHTVSQKLPYSNTLSFDIFDNQIEISVFFIEGMKTYSGTLMRTFKISDEEMTQFDKDTFIEFLVEKIKNDVENYNNKLRNRGEK